MMLKTSMLRYILLLFCFFPARLLAYEVIFTQISTSEGLSSNFVNCVAQSGDGYIWVGTRNGLQRYDGYRFTQPYRKQGADQLPALPVDQILVSGNPKVLWLKMGQTIGLFHTGTYTFRKIDIRQLITGSEKFDFNIFRDSRGNTYLVVRNIGIFVYNAGKQSFERNPEVLDYPANWIPQALQEDRDGRLWVAGVTGLGCFDPKAHRFYTPDNNPLKLPLLAQARGLTYVTNLSIDRRGRIFLNTWPGYQNFYLYLLDPLADKPRRISYEPEKGASYHELINTIERRGIIWGFGERVFNIFDEDEKAFQMFYDPQSTHYGIRINHVYQLFEDRDGNIWVATDNGLYIASVLEDNIRNGSIPYFGEADITGVKRLSGKRILFTSWGNGVRALGYDRNLHIREFPELSEAVYRGAPAGDHAYRQVWDALEIPSANEIWLACQNGRLITYDTRAGKSRFLAPLEFRNSTVRSICMDKYGELWFGSHQGQLVRRRKNGSFELVQQLGNAIPKIFSDRKGQLWVATEGNGLFQVDAASGRVVRTYKEGTPGQHISTNHINDLIQLNDSLLVVACSANLDLINLRTGKVRQITAYEGLPQRVVISLQTDGEGYLWMGTIGGICRYDLKNNIFRMYDRRDGLINASSNAYLMNRTAVLEDGNLVFSGERSFVVFKPGLLGHSFVPKKVAITDFKLFDQYLSTDSILREGGVNLRYNQNFISISFAALSYEQSNKLKYYYKLEGASKNWVRVENGQSANFASLAPGDYTFMVRAQNSDGIFFTDITALPIRITPAFWQTWWFLALVVIIALIPFYVIYRLRIRRLMEVQSIREKVARDLHDDVGSTLTSINILSEMARAKLGETEDTARDYLARISTNSSEMMESMDDIVWSIKPDNDNLLKIAARMREYTAVVLEPQHIDYTFNSREVVRNIRFDMEERRHIFLIFKEALNNILKYAQASRVDISLTHTASHVLLEIRDNGRGFDPLSESNGNGLSNMSRRAQLLKGSLYIKSAPGEGTMIRLELKIS